MRTLGAVLGAVVMVTQGAGCAAVLAPKTTAVRFDSTPPGADVYVDGARVGATPTVTELSNAMPHVATVQKDGYKQSSCRFYRSVGGGWVILDIVMGFWPVVIDAATGSWYGLAPDTCSVVLSPKRGAPGARSSAAGSDGRPTGATGPTGRR